MTRPNFVPLLVLSLAACQSAPTPAPTTAPSNTPATASPTDGPTLSADGRAFAAETRYLGTCAPAGSRGGCYRFRFAPDGTATHVLLDAPQHGRYRIEGDALLFTADAPDAQEQRLPFTEGRRVLGGEYRLEP